MTRRRFAVAVLGLSCSLPAAAQDPLQDTILVPLDPLERPAPIVWLESLFKAPGVRYDGNFVYHPRKILLNGEPFDHGMTVDVRYDPEGPGEYCGMTIPIQGKFLRFQATLCRDDKETEYGTGYCYFEVYGDSKLLFRSDALRSQLYSVVVDDTRGKRFRPQKLDVDIKGIRLLRLVVRYANDFIQKGTAAPTIKGDNVRRAAGCAWCEAKLLTGEGATLATDRLKERDERIRTAAKLAARTLKRQLGQVARTRDKFAIGLLPIREEFRVSPDDLLIRPQLARVFFGSEEGDGLPLGAPLPSEKATALREALKTFSPKSVESIATAAEEGRYAGATYLIAGHIELEKLYLILFDVRPERGELVGTATGWLNPP